MTTTPHPTCTAHLAVTGLCGKPAVLTIVIKGHTYHECAEHAGPVPTAAAPLAAGTLVRVGHAGLTKYGRIEKVTPTRAFVAVTVYPGTRREMTKTIIVPLTAVTVA